jgi:hypothetical protein
MEKTIMTIGDANSSGGKVVAGSAAHITMGKAVPQTFRRILEAVGAQTLMQKVYTAQVLPAAIQGLAK